MAVTAPTKLSDFSGFIHADQAEPIFERAARMSVAQRLARKQPLSFRGVEVPVVTGRPTASWVAEGDTKPASTQTMSLKTMTPKKLVTLIPVSQEVVRANPGGFMTLIRDSVADAFAAAFDSAAFHGTNTPFDDYLDETGFAAEIGAHDADEGGVHQDLVTALDLLVTAGKRLTGWALDDVMEPNILGSVDANGRPLYIDLITNDTAVAPGDAMQPPREGRLLRRPSWMSDTVATADKSTVIGYGGDWSQAAWGVVGSGIEWAVSTETAVTINGSLVSAFEKNLVVVRAEAEYGWLVNDVNSFVRLSNLAGS